MGNEIGHFNQESCSICLETLIKDPKELKQMVKLSCEHVYHTKCIKNWMKENQNCPICKVVFSTPVRAKTMAGKDITLISKFRAIMSNSRKLKLCFATSINFLSILMFMIFLFTGNEWCFIVAMILIIIAKQIY